MGLQKLYRKRESLLIDFVQGFFIWVPGLRKIKFEYLGVTFTIESLIVKNFIFIQGVLEEIEEVSKETLINISGYCFQ